MYRFGLGKTIKILDRLFLLVSVLAVASLIAEYGFYLSPDTEHLIHRLDIFIVWYFVLQALIKLFLARDRWDFLKTHWFDYLLVFVILSSTAVIIKVTGVTLLGKFLSGKGVVQITKLYIAAFQVSIILSLFSQGVLLNQRIASYRIHPAQVLLGSFFLIIVVGTVLLMMPRAVQPGKELTFIDALFTSTSATCVTGLIVVDTGQHFSLLGQTIIMFLIQVGGLGLMTFASFFAIILRRTISLKEKSMMREIMNYESMGLVSKLLMSTIIFTFAIEGFGAILLFLGTSGASNSAGHQVYAAVFHSVSAFCNAGFSLNSDSFMQYQGDYLVLLTISGLIILGGIGFPVLINIFGRKSILFERRRWLNVQSRLVIGISALLLIVGTIFVLLAESGDTMAGLSWGQKVLNAFFQSVTTRTAGFNTLDIGLISTPTILLFLLLMFIGASPGSTGGGIKTTTLGILMAGVWSVIKGRNRIELFRKDIPFTVLNRAMVILIFSFFFIFVATIILSFSENLPLLDLVFEEFSAFGTVGLSRGITPFFSSLGKVVIIVSMFFGRLGALTISLAITAPKESYHYDYPSENVMVG